MQVISHKNNLTSRGLTNTRTNMPAKIDDNENLRFLMACFLSSEPNRVDFHEVGKQFNIGQPAARMRLLRLKDSISGKQESKPRKRRSSIDHDGKQRRQKNTKAKEGLEKNWMGMVEDDDDDEEIVVRSRAVKKEEHEEEEDWKMLPEARLPTAQAPQYRMGGVEQPTGTMQSPPPIFHQTSQIQMPMQMPPQMSTNASMTQAYPSPQIAASQTPYFNLGSYQAEQRQKQQLDPYPTTMSGDLHLMHIGEVGEAERNSPHSY